MTDPIADMLSRIRNAIAVNKSSVSLPYSDLKKQVADILAKNGFLIGVKTTTEDGRKVLSVVISDEMGSPAITEISRLSRPGRRQYVKAKDIPSVKRGRGIVVISTSQGMMTGQQAKTKKQGGELICEVY